MGMGVYAGMHTLKILWRLKVISPPVGNSLRNNSFAFCEILSLIDKCEDLM